MPRVQGNKENSRRIYGARQNGSTKPLSDIMQTQSHLDVPTSHSVKTMTSTVIENPSYKDKFFAFFKRGLVDVHQLVSTNYGQTPGPSNGCTLPQSSVDAHQDHTKTNRSDMLDENCNYRVTSMRAAKQRASEYFLHQSGAHHCNAPTRVVSNENAHISPTPAKRRRTSVDCLSEPSIHGPVFCQRKSDLKEDCSTNIQTNIASQPPDPCAPMPLEPSLETPPPTTVKQRSRCAISKKAVERLFCPSIHFVPLMQEPEGELASPCRSLRARPTFSVTPHKTLSSSTKADVLHSNENLTNPIPSDTTSSPLPRQSPTVESIQTPQESCETLQSPLIVRMAEPFYMPTLPLLNSKEVKYVQSDAKEVPIPVWRKLSDAECALRRRASLKKPPSSKLTNQIALNGKRKLTITKEDLSDACFLARHSKYASDERRREKLERRQIKEMQQRQKFLQRKDKQFAPHLNTNLPKEAERLHFPRSLHVYPEHVNTVQFVNDLPLIAFGTGIPALPDECFELKGRVAPTPPPTEKVRKPVSSRLKVVH